MSSTHMAEMVAFKVCFLGKNPICRASSYRGGELSMFRITRYRSKWIALMMGPLFFSWRLVRNWVPRRAYIPSQSSAPWKETMMVCLLSTRENNVVQSSRVAVKVSKMNIMLFGNVRRGMNGFKHVIETICGPRGASSESMVTTFSAA
uniref:Uncharacterized protein n=1 Tax=Romanomermis culicivorax TaxID=13658 RepID=A0A915KIS3_ROMCU